MILGYFNNDPSHPVILGSLYSSNKKPPYELTADNYKKAIITKGQLKIEFDDEKKILTIVTPANNQIVIDDDLFAGAFSVKPMYFEWYPEYAVDQDIDPDP